MRKLFSMLRCKPNRRSVLLLTLMHIFVLSSQGLNAQVCDCGLELTTQAEVDAFNYTEVTGNLSIQGFGSTITNLDGLSNLTTVGGLFSIANTNITSLSGLSNLTSVGYFSIQGNSLLTNLTALTNFTGIHSDQGTLFISGNNALTNLDGLSSITELGGLTITQNPALSDIAGLSHLQDINYGGLQIEHNPSLTNIDGLSQLIFIVSDINIIGNHELQNLDGLSGLTAVFGDLNIRDNFSLSNIEGLSNLDAIISGGLSIERDSALSNLNGLSNLLGVNQGMVISNNPSLIDFCALYNLFHSGTIGGSVFIRFNGANTVNILGPGMIINADPGDCYAVVASANLTPPLVDGCLVPITVTHSDFPANDVYPVGNNQITWTATDAAGNTATATQIIEVVDNQPPTISCLPGITVSCAADVPPVDIHSVTASDNCSYFVIHLRDDTTNKTCANRLTIIRTYQAEDPAHNTATCSQVITVNDSTPPQITGLCVSQSSLWPANHTMRDITVNYSVTDNCSNATTIVTVTSNEPVNGTADGDTAPDWIVEDNHHIQLRAERAANGTGRIYTITVTVSDGCNAPVSASTQVVVVHNITGPTSGHPFIIGSSVNFSGEFWDSPTNKHTSKWLIDDNTVKGTVTEPTANKNGKVTGSYKFNSAGVYKLQMNLTDQKGVTSYANTNGDIEEIVVIYDPNGGYTYGGGWYPSQPGALTSDPTAAGKASYGFAVNYFKSSTYPKGESEFEFKVGSLEFDALNFDYLVINGAKAQFRGTGKITGDQSGYGFIISVIDGDLDGSGVDKIRMKIYNKNTGRVVYDSQPNASDAADPTTAVGLNSSIVISSLKSITTKASRIGQAEQLPAQFYVSAIPNPTNTNFNLQLRSSNISGKVLVQVADISGKIIEVRNVDANQTFSLGNAYRPGVYIVKFLQGKQHTEVKLVKF